MSKAKDKAAAEGELLVCRNPKAQHDFEIEEKLEAGMVLTGSEVKSLRARRADIEAAYATVNGAELFLHNMHIAPYEQAGVFGHEPKRPRKLLAHRAEILKLLGKLAHRGYTLVPLRVYFKQGRAKVELALGRGKKRADRREDIKRDIDLREARDAITRGGKR